METRWRMPPDSSIGPLVFEAGEPHRSQELARTGLVSPGVEFTHLDLQHDVAEDRSPVEQDIRLEDDTHVGDWPVHPPAGNLDGSFRRELESRGERKQRTLPAAARAQHREEFPTVQCETDVLQRADVSGSGLERLANAPELERGTHAVPSGVGAPVTMRCETCHGNIARSSRSTAT